MPELPAVQIRSLRAWQREALELYQSRQPRDFLAVATPGAGKTTFALTLAADLLHRGVVRRIVVVAPTEHLKVQWAHAAARMGIALDPAMASRGVLAPTYDGFAVTYAGLASNPNAFRIRIEQQRTFVILDEVHHAGDALSWGEAVDEACEPAIRRLALTGTPFRSDDNPIPYVTYAPNGDGTMSSVADYSYGYAEALRDNVVRPVLFMAYSGEMQWRTRAGDEISARLGEPLTRDMMAQALRTALDPHGAWVPAVLSAAVRRLDEVRRHVDDAGGLVIAGDQATARAYAAMLKEMTGEDVTLVLSDEAGSSERIQEFAAGASRWMVAVRMVSEGVDVPRLAVGVYATPTGTPLFFAQAVGRFVRARRRGETATVFVPSVPAILQHANDMEKQRDHVVGRPVKDEDDLFAAEAELLARANREESTADELDGSFAALGSDASFDRVLYDGGEYAHASHAAPGSEEELDFIGIPGLLEPSQVAELLHHARSKRSTGTAQRAAVDTEAATFARLSDLRRELNDLVAAWHHRTGQPHGVTHTQLRQATGGPATASASVEQIQARIDLLRAWALRASG